MRGHQPGNRVVCPAKFEGAGSLKIFTLEENPRTGQCIKLRTGQHRGAVGDTTQNTDGLFNRCKGYVNHVRELRGLGGGHS